MKKVFLSLLMLSVFSSSLCFADDVTGSWSGQFGEQAYEGQTVLNVTSQSGKVKVSFGFGAADHAKLDGNQLTFDFREGGRTYFFEATITGDSMYLHGLGKDGSRSKGTLKRLPQGEPPPGNALMTTAMTEWWKPVPKEVDPGPYLATVPTPSDAIVLFDGKDLSSWQSRDGSEAKWKVENGTCTPTVGSSDITTRQKFGDYQLHVEWREPSDIQGSGQARGNSGLFLQDMTGESHLGWNWYEIQILDSYNNPTYVNGQAGSIYRQRPPLVNSMRKPGEWNVYDVIYTAPRFNNNGTLFAPARVTLLHNGVLVQNNSEIRGDTLVVGLPSYPLPHGKASISLQNHGEPVNFRNIWIRELDL